VARAARSLIKMLHQLGEQLASVRGNAAIQSLWESGDYPGQAAGRDFRNRALAIDSRNNTITPLHNHPSSVAIQSATPSTGSATEFKPDIHAHDRQSPSAGSECGSTLAKESMMNDWPHNLPTLWMALLVFGSTYLVTVAIYAVVALFAVGERARSFKAVSPGLLSPLGVIFGQRRRA
jgi:hypothetical protein